jgi:hypothetical protein
MTGNRSKPPGRFFFVLDLKGIFGSSFGHFDVKRTTQCGKK